MAPTDPPPLPPQPDPTLPLDAKRRQIWDDLRDDTNVNAYSPGKVKPCFELDGAQGQKANYDVGPDGDLRPHPGPGYEACVLYRDGLCNNYGAFRDQFRHGDPMGKVPKGGLCFDCWQRRKILVSRDLTEDFGNDSSPKREKFKNNFAGIIPLKPSFEEHPVKTILFFGDQYTPRIHMGEKMCLDVDLQPTKEMGWTHTIKQRAPLDEDEEARPRWVVKRPKKKDPPQQPSEEAGKAVVLYHGGLDLEDEPPEKGELNVKIHDSQPLLCSAHDLVLNAYEMYCRDCTAKVSPGLLTLVHNLDPDVVVISAGNLDLTEGSMPKDVFFALKTMGEAVLAVPRERREDEGEVLKKRNHHVSSQAVMDVTDWANAQRQAEYYTHAPQTLIEKASSVSIVTRLSREHEEIKKYYTSKKEVAKKKKYPRKLVYYGIPMTPTIKEFPSMQFRRTKVMERLKYFAQDNEDIIVVEADDVSGESTNNPSFPMTDTEYSLALAKVLAHLRIEDSEGKPWVAPPPKPKPEEVLPPDREENTADGQGA